MQNKFQKLPPVSVISWKLNWRCISTTSLGSPVILIAIKEKKYMKGTFLAVQWLRPCTPNTGGMGSTPGWKTKVLHTPLCGQNK